MIKYEDMDFEKVLKSVKALNSELQQCLPDKIDIARATSSGIGGKPLNSIQAVDYEYARMIATLDVVIVESPEWWDSAGFCPDDDFLFELWAFFLKSEKKYSKNIKKNSFRHPRLSKLI